MAIENTHASINVELSKTQSCNIMKQIEVVAAIIRDEEGCVFATQRGLGEWKDWWEFPGGKVEAGETPEEALKREIQEELETEICVDEFLMSRGQATD